MLEDVREPEGGQRAMCLPVGLLSLLFGSRYLSQGYLAPTAMEFEFSAWFCTPITYLKMIQNICREHPVLGSVTPTKSFALALPRQPQEGF